MNLDSAKDLVSQGERLPVPPTPEEGQKRDLPAGLLSPCPAWSHRLHCQGPTQREVVLGR